MGPDPQVATLKGAPWLAESSLQRLLGVLNEAGVARVAGGAVRNGLMGLPISDVDVATTLTPDRVTTVCQAARFSVHPTGLQHGTVTVVVAGAPYEVTTLRRDVACDGRHAEVAFTHNWAEDAGRRDFTINALYCDRDGTVHDPLGGLVDLDVRRVRFVGVAEDRIREDYLRILRFFRFHARFGEGEPDAAGLSACAKLRDGLGQLSAERITAEMLKLLVAPGAVRAVQVMEEAGILAAVGVEQVRPGRLAAMALFDVAAGLEPDGLLRFAALAGPEGAERARVRLSNDEKARVNALGQVSGLEASVPDSTVKAILYRSGLKPFQDAVRFSAVADLAFPGLDSGTAQLGSRSLARATPGSGPGQAPGSSPGEAIEEEPTKASEQRPTKTNVASLTERAEAGLHRPWINMLELAGEWPIPVFPVDGRDLIERGFGPGPALGEALRQLEDRWIAEGFPPDKTQVLDWLAAKE